MNTEKVDRLQNSQDVEMLMTHVLLWKHFFKNGNLQRRFADYVDRG